MDWFVYLWREIIWYLWTFNKDRGWSPVNFLYNLGAFANVGVSECTVEFDKGTGGIVGWFCTNYKSVVYNLPDFDDGITFYWILQIGNYMIVMEVWGKRIWRLLTYSHGICHQGRLHKRWAQKVFNSCGRWIWTTGVRWIGYTRKENDQTTRWSSHSNDFILGESDGFGFGSMPSTSYRLIVVYENIDVYITCYNMLVVS